MKRTITTHLRATATLALACATALVFAVATVQARPTHTAGAQAATAALSDCTIVISGAPWRIRARGILSGDKYTLKARDISCSSVRARVVAFTHKPGIQLGAAFKGPSGFLCKSFSTATSGDKLLYSGVCMRGPHNDPFFEWGPKVPGH
jgi:hypothetical protein